MNFRICIFIVTLGLLAPSGAKAGVSFSGLRNCVLSLLSAGNQDPKSWNERISFKSTEKELSQGKIVRIQSLNDYLAKSGSSVTSSMGALLLTYDSGLMGVWKPNLYNSGRAEVGAYEALHKLIRSKLIPPTVFRDISVELSTLGANLPPQSLEQSFNGGLGSIQFFVDSGPGPLTKEIFDEHWPKISEKEKSDWGVFIFVFGQYDSRPQNIGIDDTDTIFAIDNQMIKMPQKVRFGETPFISWGTFQKSAWRGDWPEDFPFDQAVTLNNPDYNELKNILSGKISQFEFDNIWNNSLASKKDRTLSIVFWQNKIWIRSIGFANFGL